jgi:hypothetical protein
MLAAPHAAASEAALRVCAEPQNMPMSRRDGAGFENSIARVLADELHRQLVYAWQPQRRGFVRKTIGADLCDVWIGVPAGFDSLLTTRPYYRSGFVFVNRRDAVSTVSVPKASIAAVTAGLAPCMAVVVTSNWAMSDCN